LLNRTGNPPHAAILEGPLNHRYELTGGEIERPVTPRLQQQFDSVSSSRTKLLGDNKREYYDLRQQHADLFDAPGIRKISAAQANALRSSGAVEVEDGDTVVEVFPRGSNKVLYTTGVADCVTPSAMAIVGNNVILGLAHYNGIDANTNQDISPTEQLEMLEQKMREAIKRVGGDKDTLMSMQLTGAEAIPNSPHFGDEIEFLDSKNFFPITSARMYEVIADKNSEGYTIQRFTNDDHASQINVVQTETGTIISHGELSALNGRSLDLI